MKEQLNLTISDLDDLELTSNRLLLMFDKILEYYNENNKENLVRMIQGFAAYFSVLYQGIEESEQGGIE